MDATQNWFFWTWHIGNTTLTNQPANPFWCYKCGLEAGYIPTDPRNFAGTCQRVAPDAESVEFVSIPASAIGQGSGTVAAAELASYAWPPEIEPAGDLPVYTATGTIFTLSPPVITGALDGWFDDSDTELLYTPIAGCDYVSLFF